jgi:hypothetical protein
MDTAVKVKLHRFGAWCGAGYVVSLIIGWIFIAGFLPPPSPAAPAEQIAAIFQQDTNRIRIGMLFVMLGALLMIPFTASIVRMLSRIEGGPGMLGYSALLGGVGNMVLTFYPATYWLWGAYRPDRDPQLLYMINDLAWLQFIGGVTMYLGLPLAIAAGGLLDTRPNPVIPRWAGYANIWMVIIIIPDQLLFFFQSGPFTWNGVFGLYLPLTSFFGWFALTVYLVLKSADRVVAEESVPLPSDSASPAPRG